MAHLHGNPSHRLLQKAIESLTHDSSWWHCCWRQNRWWLWFTHAKTWSFFPSFTQARFCCLLSARYAVGANMLSHNERESAEALILKMRLAKSGSVLWLGVMSLTTCLGPIALDSVPQFKQVFINNTAKYNEQEFSAKLLLARRDANKQLRNDDLFCVNSLSSRLVSYRLNDACRSTAFSRPANPEVETAICIFHQRFSTNTNHAGNWHSLQNASTNGEINTITGNRTVDGTYAKFVCDLLPNPNVLAPWSTVQVLILQALITC